MYKAVFSFTLRQMLKSRANRTTFLVLLVLILVAIPVGAYLTGDAGSMADGPAGGLGTDVGYADYRVVVSDVNSYLYEQAEAQADAQTDAQFSIRYAVQYLYAVLVLILCMYVVTYIVRTVVEEKSSRLMETLLLSVKPMDLLVGKVLAVMVYLFAFLLLLGCGAYLTYQVTGLFLPTGGIGVMLEGFGLSLSLLHLDGATVAVVAVSLLLAYGFFSCLAGLCGAGCDDINEAGQAANVPVLLLLAAYLLSLTTPLGNGGLLYGAVLCPVLSTFTLPAAYLLGRVSLPWVFGSWAIQILVILGIVRLSARVYTQLLLYRGARIPMRRILRMAKGDH